MITNTELFELLKSTSALLEGHFKLTSGRHSNRYVEKFRILENPDALNKVCQAMAEPYKDKNIEGVLGAAVGGILLAGGVGRHLGVRHIFTERVNNEMMLRRGFFIDPGMRILIVEDIVTTGGSVRELKKLAENSGADIAGIVSMVDRSSDNLVDSRHYHTLLQLPIDSWEPQYCKFCSQGVQLTTRGRSGKINKQKSIR